MKFEKKIYEENDVEFMADIDSMIALVSIDILNFWIMNKKNNELPISTF